MEKKKQYATCALDSTSPKEGEGGGGGKRVGYVLAVSPICHFFKSIFWAWQQISTTISDSRKALLVLLWKRECFAVCWGFKLCLALIYMLKVGKRGENFGNIASISQTHLFHKFILHHISLSTHTSGGIAKPVTFYRFDTIV